MNRKKLCFAALLFLLLLNIVCLFYLWNYGNFNKDPRNKIGDYLVKELNLNEHQIASFELLKKYHQEQVQLIKEKNRLFHDQYFDQLKSKALDSTLLNVTLDSITYLQRQIEIVTFKHFYQLRMISDDRQKIKFDSVIQEALRMFAPQRPPKH